MKRSVLVPVLTLVVPLVFGGCRTPSSKLPLDSLDQPSEDTPSGEQAIRVEPLPVTQAADLLPSTVYMLAEARDPVEFIEMFQPLVNMPGFADARQEAAKWLGADLMVPAEWSKLGIDNSGPAGVGVLDASSETFFAYLTISNPAVFETSVVRVMRELGQGDEIAINDVGYGRILRVGDELSIVLRENVAMLTFSDHPERSPRDFGAIAATIDPRESLGQSENFKWVQGELEPEDDALMYLVPAPLFDVLIESGDHDQKMAHYADSQVTDARARGADAEELRELEEYARSEREWAEERRLAKLGERKFIRDVFGPIDVLYGAVDLQAEGMDAHGQALIRKQSLLHSLFVPERQESPLLRALGEAPLFVLDGQADMDTLVQLVDLVFQASGENLQSINGVIVAEIGVDFLADVLPTMRGDGGIAITQSAPPNPAKFDKLSKSLGMAAHVGLVDPDGMRAVFDAMVRSKRPASFGRARRGGGWTLDVPGWRTVNINIEGDRLLLSTDLSFAGRVRDARAGSQAKALAAVDHPLRGPMLTPAMRFYQRWTSLAIVAARDPWIQEPESMLYNMNDHHQLTSEEAAKVRRSRAFNKKFKEFKKSVAELNAFQRRRAVKSFEQLYELSERAGDLGISVERLSDGLGVRAHWRHAPDWSLVEAGANMFTINRGGDWTEEQRITEEVFRLRDALSIQRQADLDAYASKHHKP